MKKRIEEHNDLAIENQYLRNAIERANKALDEETMARIIRETAERIEELDGR